LFAACEVVMFSGRPRPRQTSGFLRSPTTNRSAVSLAESPTSSAKMLRKLSALGCMLSPYGYSAAVTGPPRGDDSTCRVNWFCDEEVHFVPSGPLCGC
ncbi:MAG: hypothetical protein ACPIOQ_74100, partial [Promethearchaeia archaeon]